LQKTWSVTVAVHLLWMVAKEEVLVAEASEVEEEAVAVVVERILVFSFKRDSVPSVKAVDSHMRVLELVLVGVSEGVQTTVRLKEVEDRGSQHMVDNSEVEADTPSQWEH